MSSFRTLSPCCGLLLGCVLLAAGCNDGSDGDQGPPGPPGPPGTGVSATELNITVDSVSIASPPVVEFTVTDQDGDGFPGLTGSDLRFNIAKLIPVANGNPSQWQDYILRERDGAVQGTQERDRTGSAFGEFVDNGDGTYTYTFETDITNVSCPAPCTDADGNALDVSYQPGLTHRVGIQQGNRDLPTTNTVYDFVPNGGAGSMREIVKTDNCNECHDKLTAHGTRYETKLCVTCHNPGSWVADDDGDKTVDFKVMIHKIHRGEHLPSVEAGGSYHIGSDDFSDVAFPQDIRNCTKCHDGDDPDTPQGNNWQIPNMAACGSCHDDIDFSKDGSGDPPVDPNGHSGGIVNDDSTCIVCHRQGENSPAGSVAESHTIPGRAERAFFQYNILEICGIRLTTDPKSNPKCPAGTSPTVTFSVTDPSKATTHAYGNAYDILPTSTDPEYASSDARLRLDIAWDTRDYTNDRGTGERPAEAVKVDLRASGAVSPSPLGNGEFIYDGALDSPVVRIPANDPLIATPIGSGAVALEGRGTAYDSDTKAYTSHVLVNSPVAYFAVNDSTPQPRRQVVDAPTKCDRCHDVLNAHGGSRTDNGQLCVMCHNSSNTDVNDRAKDPVTGLPLPGSVDGKTEEAIDFKRMIHGIHAAAVTNFDGTDAHGFRQHGLTIGSEIDSDSGLVVPSHDYSDLRFPGVLSKCGTCHLTEDDQCPADSGEACPDTYTLEDRSGDGGGNWVLPAMDGIRGSTVNSYPNALPDGSDFAQQLVDQGDDWKYSPIASVCSSCHDGTPELAHMADNGALLGGAGSEQAAQEGNVESCPVCHGPGRVADVEVVHND